jgi:alanine racemase
MMMESSSNKDNNNKTNVSNSSITTTTITAAGTATTKAVTAPGRRPPPPPVRDVLLGRSIVSNNHNNNNNSNNNNGMVISDTDRYRAVHRINLSALARNYNEIESAANKQRCSVIVVVKADGYGHGAIPTALFLADIAGADSFAVATLEEAIALRRAFERTSTTTTSTSSTIGCGGSNGINNLNSTTFRKNSGGTVATTMGDDLSTIAAWSAVGGGGGGVGGINHNYRQLQQQHQQRSLRPAHIRILVLGPPVGFPRCFDDYYHHNIEVMISGPEVARALLEWVYNKDERKRTLVERVANESKERILSSSELLLHYHPLGQAKPKRTDDIPQLQQQEQPQDTTSNKQQRGDDWMDAISLASSRSGNTPPAPQQHKQSHQYHPPSATLGNVTGMDLAKEVREILKNQKLLAESQQLFQQQQQQQQKVPPASKSIVGGGGSSSSGTHSRKASGSLPSTGTHSRKASGSLPPMSALTFTPVSSNQDLTAKLDPTNDGTATAATTTTTSCDPTITGKSSLSSSSSSSNSSPAIVHKPPIELPTGGPIQVFAGIEEAAKYSRTRQKVIISRSTSITSTAEPNGVFHDRGDDDDHDHDGYKDDHNGENDDDHDIDHYSDDAGVVTGDVVRYNDQYLENIDSNLSRLREGGELYTESQHSIDAGDIPLIDASTLVDCPTATTSSSTTSQGPAVRSTNDHSTSKDNARTGSKGILTNVNPTATSLTVLPIPRKRLRWHAEVESGMGRSGFQTDCPVMTKDDDEGQQVSQSATVTTTATATTRRDPVSIIKELVDLEVKVDCPIEFYGMCTHMADAHSNSTYTNEQIAKFKSLLRRVREDGISVPTISTDNSAALLTTNLTHFDPKELLTQSAIGGTDSRGYVRTGGGIYGQRPTFTQLRPVSTLLASIRHIAVLRQGESVGYDRAYVAPTKVRIATIAIGFADGYPRELGNGVGKVSIRGHIYPTAGNVCMDMLMVELGSVDDEDDGIVTGDNYDNANDDNDDGGGDNININNNNDNTYSTSNENYSVNVGAQIVVGDTAILWGPDPENGDDGTIDEDDDDVRGHVRLQDLASILKTTQSALTCGLNKERVLRQYA